MELMEIVQGVVEQTPGLGLMGLFGYLMLRMLGEELRRYHQVLDGVLLRIADKLDKLEDTVDALGKDIGRRG